MSGLKVVIVIAGLCVLPVVSCMSLREMQNDSDYGAVESENHILKNKQILVERRNSVLEEENISIRKEVRDKDARITLLESELQIEKKSHSNDEKLWKQKYGSLSDRFAASEEESARKIRELTDLNHKTENDLNLKIKELSVEILKKDSDRAHAIENEKKVSAKREYELSRTNEDLQKELTGRDERIIRLEERIRVLESESAKRKNDLAGK